MAISVQGNPVRASVRVANTPGRWLPPLLIGVLAFVVSFAGSWIPSIYSDEAVTLSAATRSWSELRTLLKNVDAVHGLFYAVMHAWHSLFGTSAVALRLPSALAVGAATAGVVVLGRRLGSARTGVFAGLAFAILPRATSIGIEGRSPAMTVAVSVWLTLVLLTASERGRVAWWVLYGVVAAVSVALWIFLVLLIAAHGATLLWARRQRREVLTWASASILGILAASPVILLARTQTIQISWLARPGADSVKFVIVEQWFGTQGWPSVPIAALCWLLVGVGLLALYHSRKADRGALTLLQVALPWMVLPTPALLAYSMFSTPLYSPRYVAFALPAVALLIGAGIASVEQRRLRAIVLLAIAVLATPSFLSARHTDSMDNSDWSTVALIIATNTTAGDAVLYGDLFDTQGLSRGSARAIAFAYPKPFVELDDVALAGSAAEEGSAWGTSRPFPEAAGLLAGRTTLWVVYDHQKDFLAPENADRQVLVAAGFTVTRTWVGGKTDVVHLVRAPA